MTINTAWERNELNKNSMGGSEQMAEGLMARLDPELANKFQIITSRVRELKEDKIRIYWLHDLPGDPETKHLKAQKSRDRFHKIVYCGNWQQNAFQMVHDIPFDTHSTVIETAITPFPEITKPTDGEIRLVYTSTPQRGLEILVPVFIELCKKHDNITLDVFSSFKIYGWEDSDRQYEPLYEMCRQHPKINYHGYAPNEVVRETVEKAHIFAYPSIWMECNSRSLIEAMSAGCLAVHPNYAGLADTAGGLTAMYQWDKNPNVHASVFYSLLDEAIGTVSDENLQGYLRFVKMYADQRYNWGRIVQQWTNLLTGLAAQYEGKDLSLPDAGKEIITFNTTR